MKNPFERWRDLKLSQIWFNTELMKSNQIVENKKPVAAQKNSIYEQSLRRMHFFSERGALFRELEWRIENGVDVEHSIKELGEINFLLFRENRSAEEIVASHPIISSARAEELKLKIKYRIDVEKSKEELSRVLKELRMQNNT